MSGNQLKVPHLTQCWCCITLEIQIVKDINNNIKTLAETQTLASAQNPRVDKYSCTGGIHMHHIKAFQSLRPKWPTISRRGGGGGQGSIISNIHYTSENKVVYLERLRELCINNNMAIINNNKNIHITIGIKLHNLRNPGTEWRERQETGFGRVFHSSGGLP